MRGIAPIAVAAAPALSILRRIGSIAIPFSIVAAGGESLLDFPLLEGRLPFRRELLRFGEFVDRQYLRRAVSSL